jgi:hypothetical protein
MENKVKRKKFYQNSSKPVNYVPNVLVSNAPLYPPTMSGLMHIDPTSGDIWLSAGNTLVTDWRLITGGGGVSGTISIQYNGTPVSAAATILNFVGATSVSGDPNVTVTIPTGPVIFKNTSVGASVKNTLIQGVTYSQLIPKDTVKPGSIIRISYRVKKSTLDNNAPTQIGINIGASFAASTQLTYADISWSVLLPNTYGQLKREFVIDSGTSNTKYINNKNTFFNDSIDALTEESSSINWTVNQTLYFTIQHLASAIDSAAGSFYCIEIY